MTPLSSRTGTVPAVLFACALLLGACAPVRAPAPAANPAQLKYPAAPRGPTVDDYHGVRVRRSLPWLRGP